MATVQIVSCLAAAVSLASFTGLALLPSVVGPELECFPKLQDALAIPSAIGSCGFFVAAIGGLVSAWPVVFKKEPPTFGRLGGLAGALLAFLLLSTPPFGDGVRRAFGMSAHGPVCKPAGLLGSNPDLWRSLSRAMGYRPKPSSWPL